MNYDTMNHFVGNDRHWKEPRRGPHNRRLAASINYQRHAYHHSRAMGHCYHPQERLRDMRLTRRITPKRLQLVADRIWHLQLERSIGFRARHGKDWNLYDAFCVEYRKRQEQEIEQWRIDNPKRKRVWKIEIVKIKDGKFEAHVIYDREIFAITSDKYDSQEEAMTVGKIIQNNAKKFFKTGSLTLAITS
jgi:hypothetical protein